MVTYNLHCYDGRASFYGKATVDEDENVRVLKSYGTKIAIYDKGSDTLQLVHDPACSQTTMRHFRSFLCGLNYFHGITKAFVDAMDFSKVYTRPDYYALLDSKKAYKI